MATTEAQRKELWGKLCKSTDQKIREEHAPMKNTTDFSWHALKGWVRNQWERPTYKQDVAGYVTFGVSRVATFFINVPVLGSLLNLASDQATALWARKSLEQSL